MQLTGAGSAPAQNTGVEVKVHETAPVDEYVSVRGPPAGARVFVFATKFAVSATVGVVASCVVGTNAPRAMTTCELAAELPDAAVKVSVKRLTLSDVDGGM